MRKFDAWEKTRLGVMLSVVLMTGVNGVLGSYTNRKLVNREKEVFATMQKQDAALKSQSKTIEAQQRLIGMLEARLKVQHKETAIAYAYR